MNQKDIHIELHNMLEIPLDNFFTTDGNGKYIEKIVLSKKNKIFGPYINLRPNKYKIIINGENLNQNGINVYGTYKKTIKDKVAVFYKIISNNFNEIVGEINENNFLFDFELIIENSSNSEIEIKTIKIITEN